MKRAWHRILCFFGVHWMRKDPSHTNGVWWAWCNHCGTRFGGEYDMATGETHWKPR